MRIDQLLVERGLCPSREKAKRSVMAGLVLVDGQRVDKPGTPVGSEVEVTLRGVAQPWVSRAGGKLSGALDHFGIDPAGLVCLDIGASTGGFTDCLLQRGAERVYAVDVGYGQLDYKIRSDPRVVVMERVNARHLAHDALPERAQLCVVDVSFISLLKIVPALVPLLAEGGVLLPLIKPQFEAGREAVGKGGIVRDEQLRRDVIDERTRQIAALGFELRGLVDSEVAGAGGNVEALAHFVRSGTPAAEGATP